MTGVQTCALPILSFEVFLTAGLVAGAAVVLWATMSSLTGNDAAQAAGGAVARLTDGLTDAFIAGATGGQAPSDQALQPGYSAGQQFLQSVAAGNGPNEPPMREDDAAGALSDLLPGRRAGIRAHMLPLARNAIWDRFSREHQGDTQAMNTARRVIFQ